MKEEIEKKRRAQWRKDLIFRQNRPYCWNCLAEMTRWSHDGLCGYCRVTRRRHTPC